MRTLLARVREGGRPLLVKALVVGIFFVLDALCVATWGWSVEWFGGLVMLLALGLPAALYLVDHRRIRAGPRPSAPQDRATFYGLPVLQYVLASLVMGWTALLGVGLKIGHQVWEFPLVVSVGLFVGLIAEIVSTEASFRKHRRVEVPGGS